MHLRVPVVFPTPPFLNRTYLPDQRVQSGAMRDFHFFNITVIAIKPFLPGVQRSMLNTFKR